MRSYAGGVDRKLTESVDGFLEHSRAGDYWLSDNSVVHPELTLVRSNGRHWLYYRRPVLVTADDASSTAVTDGVHPRAGPAHR